MLHLSLLCWPRWGQWSETAFIGCSTVSSKAEWGCWPAELGSGCTVGSVCLGCSVNCDPLSQPLWEWTCTVAFWPAWCRQASKQLQSTNNVNLCSPQHVPRRTPWPCDEAHSQKVIWIRSKAFTLCYKVDEEFDLFETADLCVIDIFRWRWNRI